MLTIIINQSSLSLAGISSPPTPPVACNSPPSVADTNSVLSEADPDMSQLLRDIQDNPPTPPISPQIPSSQLHIRVFYGTIQVLSEYVDCSKGSCRIVSSSRNSGIEERQQRYFYNCAHKIVLPETHPQSLSKGIFGAMEEGIVLDVSEGSVYVTPLCRTVVYYSSSASPTNDAVQINKDQPTRVFDYNNHFRPALEHYAVMQGQSPSPYFLLGLGQSWGHGRHVTQNLVTVMVTHCKAKLDIDTISLPSPLVTTPELFSLDGTDTINIDEPTGTDIEAEAFLKNLQEISN